MIIFGGLYSYTLFGDAWALSLGSPPGAIAAETEAIKPVVAESEARFALYGPVSTPVRGDLTVSFSLATGERSVIEVFSVTAKADRPRSRKPRARAALGVAGWPGAACFRSLCAPAAAGRPERVAEVRGHSVEASRNRSTTATWQRGWPFS